jgi:hypothetical protein
MRKTWIFVVAGLLLVWIGACEQMAEDEEVATGPAYQTLGMQPAEPEPAAEMPPADGQAFWRYITETNPYTQWDRWPGKEDMYPGQSPHGAYLKLYVNPVAMEALQAGNTTMPDRAILVKENYGEDRETLAAVTPMYKIAGYNSDGGDWFWAKYGPEGQDMEAGRLDGCIDCHRTAPGNDWLFTELK